MDVLLERLIVDFHERPIPDLTRRNTRLAGVAGKADAIIGMRRTGKTYLLYQAMGDLLSQGEPKEALLYVNLEDERLMPLEVADLHHIPETYFRLYPQFKERTCYLFFDEIQNVAGWERFVRRLLDTEDVRVAVTGSSSRLLSREIATALRGRSLSTEIFPFSFEEALRHEGIEPESGRRPGSKQRALLANRFQQYLFKGGFPEVQGVERDIATQILQEYVDVVILRDVVERHGITNILPLRHLLRHVLGSPATRFSVNKFYNDLRSQGVACGKNTLHEYLEYLHDAYLVYPVEIHARSIRAKRVNPRKLYVIDSGLAAAFSHEARADAGRLLENLVFTTLRARGSLVEYYRTGSGREVDFVVTSAEGGQSLVQVALDVSDKKTLEREVRALDEAMEETGIGQGSIVTLSEERLIEARAGRIRIVPAWSWVL